MADERAPKDYDVVLLGGPTEDGAGVRVLRARPGQLEAGEVRPTREGRPIVAGELVALKPRDGSERVYDVEVVHKAKTPDANAPARGVGPAQVATRTYRDHWDDVFGKADAPN